MRLRVGISPCLRGQAVRFDGGHKRDVFPRIMRAVLPTPAAGADTIVWLAASVREREHSGGFFLDRKPGRSHFLPFSRETGEDRAPPWAICERHAASDSDMRDRVVG